MVRSELPDNWQDLAAGYVLDSLSEEEAVQWEALIQEHPELSHELAILQSTFDLFADVVPLHHPPQSLLNRIRTAAQINTASADGSDASSFAPRPPVVQPATIRSQSRFRVLVGIGGVMAASVIVGLGFQLQALQQQVQQAHTKIQTLEGQLQQAQTQTQTIQPVVSTLQQPGTLIYNLEGSNLANQASGHLVMSNDQDVIIVVKNLPELPADQVYRLWANVPARTTLVYCGQFNSNHQGIIQLTPSSGQCGQNPKQMLITVDAVTDPTTRGGPVVMQGEI